MIDSENHLIDEFRKKFGIAHYYLLMHAAFPLALTPDLLYRLRITFDRDIQNRRINIPWYAPADVWFAPFMHRVQAEMVEIDSEVQDILRQRLRQHPRFGENRVRELAKFLELYAAQFSTADPALAPFLKVQGWAALTYNNPERASQQLAQEFRDLLNHGNSRQQLQFAQLTNALAWSLREQPRFLALVRANAAGILNNSQSARDNWQEAFSEGDFQIGDVVFSPLDVRVSPTASFDTSNILQEVRGTGERATTLPDGNLDDDSLRQPTTGGVVPLDSPYYIERQEDRNLRERINRGNAFLVVVGGRQSGKTSLLIRLGKGNNTGGESPVSFETAYIDFSLFSRIDNREEFLSIFMNQLAKVRSIPSVKDSVASLPTRLTTTIEEYLKVNSNLVLLLDETEALLNSIFGEEIFVMLRHWYQLMKTERVWNGLQIVLASSKAPNRFIQNQSISPFNVGDIVYLQPFSIVEFEELNRRLNLPLQTASQIETAYNLTGGYPSISVIALQAASQFSLDVQELQDEVIKPNGVFELQLSLMSQTIERLDASELIQQILAGEVVQRSSDGDELVEMGYLARSTNGYVFSSGIYQHYCRHFYGKEIAEANPSFADIYVCMPESEEPELLYARRQLQNAGFSTNLRPLLEMPDHYRAVVALVGHILTDNQVQELRFALDRGLPIIPACFVERVFLQFPSELSTLNSLFQARMPREYSETGIEQLKLGVEFFSQWTQAQRQAFYDQSHDIYISYSWKNANIIWSTIRQLKESNLSIWIDTDLIPGMEWQNVQDKKLKQSRALVVMVSPEAIQSQGVQHEVDFALANNIPILPVILNGNVQHPSLRHIQHLNIEAVNEDFAVFLTKSFHDFLNPQKEIDRDFDVFFNYSHQDLQIVTRYYDELSEFGYSIWRDQNLRLGDDWQQALQEAMRNCVAMVYFISSASVKSTYAREDLEYFLSLEKPVIPIVLEQIKPENMPFALARVQYIDASTRPLGDVVRSMIEALRIMARPISEFEPIPNPYALWGGSIVTDPSMFFGRTEIINNLLQQFSSLYERKSVFIYGQKRIGKSSILYHVKQAIQKETQNNNLIIVSMISIGSIIIDFTVTNFFYYLARDLYKEFVEKFSGLGIDHGLQIPQRNEFIDNPFNQFLDCLELLIQQSREKLSKNLTPLCIIDDFTYIYDLIKQNKLDPSFMKALKALMERRLVNFLLAGDEEAVDFIRKFPNEFGIVDLQRISYLTPTAARELIEQPIWNSKTNKSRFQERAVTRIQELTGNSPYYIQIFNTELVEYMNRRAIAYITEADVDAVLRNLTVGPNALTMASFDNLIRSTNGEDTPIKEKLLRVIAFLTKTIADAPRTSVLNMFQSSEHAIVDKLLYELTERQILSTKATKPRYAFVIGIFKEWLNVNLPYTEEM